MTFFPKAPKEPLDIYRSEDLPNNFRYPRRFLDMVGITERHWYYPWFFFLCYGDVGKLSHQLLVNKKTRIFKDKPPLIPFASLESSDGDTACFDGSDMSGNPKVIVVVFDKNGLNYGRKDYGFRNFDHWLEEAEKEAQNWDRRWIEDPEFEGYEIKYN